MLIWNYWPGPEGGTERQCRRLAQHLSDGATPCTVLTHWKAFRVPRSEQDGQVAVHRVGWFGPFAGAMMRTIRWLKECLLKTRQPSVPGQTSAAAPAGAAWGPSIPLIWLDRFCFMIAAYAYLRTNRAAIDVLHVHESHWIAGFGAWAGKKLGMPVLVKEATFPVLLGLGRGVPFRALCAQWRLRADYVAQTSAAAKGLRDAGIPQERIVTVPNGVDIPSELADVRNNGAVLYVGNLYQEVEWKAFDVLLAAWQIVVRQRASARLILVGSGDQTPWRLCVARLGVESSVMFAGHADDVSSYYGQASVFVLPSRREGMSNALLESQSWGIPAVVSNIPGNVAVVKDGENGFVVPVDDAASLARALLRLIEDVELREQMGKAGRAQMSRRFSFIEAAEMLKRKYRDLLETSPKALSA